MSTLLSVGQWVWSKLHQAPARIIERKEIWGYVNYLVWLPRDNSVQWVKHEVLTLLQERREFSLHELLYKIAAARIKDALAQDNLLALADLIKKKNPGYLTE